MVLLKDQSDPKGNGLWEAQSSARNRRSSVEYCLQEQPDSHFRFQYLSGRRKNRILFTFADCPAKARMNPSSTNSGEYRASDLRTFREGACGSGAGDKSGVTSVQFPLFAQSYKHWIKR
jgi:hypothetical protein